MLEAAKPKLSKRNIGVLQRAKPRMPKRAPDTSQSKRQSAARPEYLF
jgi:hypothetical protein